VCWRRLGSRRLRTQVGRVAFKRRVTPWKATMSSYSLHASHPSTFRAPGRGTLASLSSSCRWRNATSRKLVPFSHRSASRIFIRQPGRIPSPVVTQDDDHQFDGGEKQAGQRPLPRPQLQGSSSSLLGRRARRAGAPAPTRVGGPPLLPASGGGNHPPALRRRRPPAMPGKANYCCPARMQHSVLCPRFHGEDGSEDLPVRFGAACAHLFVIGGQADAVVDADVVAAGESFSAVEAVSATYRPTSGSLALMSGSRPLSGDANESLSVAASVLGPWLLLQRSLASRPELVAPRALRCGGCSYPWGRNRSSVCNDTLSAGVCSLWLSGHEHACIFGMKSCFFLISSTKTRLSAN
jgi:hypothetical protein